MKRASRLLPAILCCAVAWAQPIETASRKARQASEAFLRSHRTMHAWLQRTDPVTGLLPRRGNDPNWVVKDSAADLYPFLVIGSYFLEPALYDGAMRDILRQEVLLSTRIDRLSDDVAPGGKGSVFPEVDLDRIIFGSSEYIKDGLIPITELLGETPWYHRMRGIAADIVRHAPYRSPRGRLPARTSEINGNMLQLLSRLYWKTGEEELLAQAVAIADFYFLDMLPKTRYLPADLWDPESGKALRPVFVFSDHGNEIVGGLSEIYFLLVHKRPEKARQYREAFTRMIDRLLEVGLNADGVWVSRVDLETGKVADPRHAHCWGYMFNAVYTAYLATGEEKYRKAVERAIEGVTRHPKYLFDQEGAGRGWGANAYSDSIEGALVLLNRLPNRETDGALDVAARQFFDRQRPDGIIEDWYGDGNFIRTALMYAFWKTQGTYPAPWNPRLHVGAVREGDRLLVRVEAESPWQGRIRFDHPRHRDHWNIVKNYPRLNEWPEWFTVEHDQVYSVQVNDSPPRRYLGADLVSGVPLALGAGEATTLRVTPAAPYLDRWRAVADRLLTTPPESYPFNWGEGVQMIGLMKIHERTGDTRYADYVEKWGALYLPRDLAELLNIGPQPSKTTRPGYCGHWSPATALLLLYQVRHKPEHLRLAQQVAGFLRDGAERSPQRALGHWQGSHQLWVDTLYMACPLLAALGHHDDAANQLIQFAAPLQDPKTGLFYHMWDWQTNTRTPDLWGRGNGWVLMSLADTLEMLGDRHRLSAPLRAIAEKQARGLEATQDRDGLWHTVMDDPESYPEASASMMVCYGLLKLVRLGVLPARYREPARRAWTAVNERFVRDGLVTGVSAGTGPGNRTYYKSLPLGTQTWGAGAYLMAGSEITRSSSAP